MSMTELEPVKLTHMVRCAGCAAKMDPAILDTILSAIPFRGDPQVLVGFDHRDDAAVYKLPSGEMIVQTLDFFPPIVDDPYNFGAIAAANAISDVYAMNGIPLFALNICGFPKAQDSSIWRDVIRGGADMAHRAGISVLGGHTVDDAEPKYGMVVTGLIRDGKIWSNVGAKAGDKLIFTKKLGTGVITTALKNELIELDDAADAIESMKTLNREAADVFSKHDIHSCTDITGNGLLGHASEMARASNVAMMFHVKQFSWFQKAFSLAEAEKLPGGTRSNRRYLDGYVTFDDAVAEAERWLLNDAQTSGGLLAAVDAAEAEKIVIELHKAGVGDAAIVGTVKAGEGIVVAQ